MFPSPETDFSPLYGWAVVCGGRVVSVHHNRLGAYFRVARHWRRPLGNGWRVERCVVNSAYRHEHAESGMSRADAILDRLEQRGETVVDGIHVLPVRLAICNAQTGGSESRDEAIRAYWRRVEGER